MKCIVTQNRVVFFIKTTPGKVKLMKEACKGKCYGDSEIFMCHSGINEHFEKGHSPCSPDLAPSNIYLFPMSKKARRGRKFNTNSEAVWAMKNSLKQFSEKKGVATSLESGLKDRSVAYHLKEDTFKKNDLSFAATIFFSFLKFYSHF